MKKKLPKEFHLAVAVLSLIAVVGIYLGVAYKMRDASEGWCKMSMGKYQTRPICSNKLDSKKCEKELKWFCVGGVFSAQPDVNSIFWPEPRIN